MHRLRALFDTSVYTRRTERQKASFTLGIAFAIMLLFTVYATLVPSEDLPGGGFAPLVAVLHLPINVIVLVGMYVVGILTFTLVHQRLLRLAVWGPLLMISLITIIQPLAIGENLVGPASSGGLALFMILAGLLAGVTGAVIGLIVSILALLLPAPDYSGMPVLLTVLIAITMLTILFNRYAASFQAEGEVVGAGERLKLADINTQITRRAAERARMEDVLNLAIELMLRNYPQLYHAQVFLIDEQNALQARLVASSGEAGRILLAREHALAVGSLSIVGQTALKGEPVVQVAGARDSLHRYNELLPETKVEAAFPLRGPSGIIGALDLQSKYRDAFKAEDIPTFQTLADSLSLVVDNVRQFETAQEQVYENQRLAEQARHALNEVQRLNKRLIGRAWAEYLKTRTTAGGLNVDFEKNALEEDTSWTPTLAEAIQTHYLVQSGQTIAIPLRIRGQVIGAMEFELSDERPFTPDDLELVQEIGERFGLAAENTRLVEESQRAAQRESLINEIGSRLQANNTVEATLTEAVRSLSETLRAGRVAIRLGTPSATTLASPNGKKDRT